MACKLFQTENFEKFFLALKLLWHPYGVISWWYMVIGALRTQILALWKPGKQKTDFQWVQIEEISKTHFLTSNGSRIDPWRPTKAQNTNSERYWHGHFMSRKGWPLQNQSSRLQSVRKGSNRKPDLRTSKCNFSKNVSLNWLKLKTYLVLVRTYPKKSVGPRTWPFFGHLQLFSVKFSFLDISDLWFWLFSQLWLFPG